LPGSWDTFEAMIRLTRRRGSRVLEREASDD